MADIDCVGDSPQVLGGGGHKWALQPIVATETKDENDFPQHLPGTDS